MAGMVARSEPSTRRKPFRSISQVLDTPPTPELLAALPAPVQQTNLMMGPKQGATNENHTVDPQLVNNAMASFQGEANLLVAAESQQLLDLFKGLSAQLRMKVRVRTALGKQALTTELNNAAKAIVEGSGRQFDVILCDPEVVKQDGQLVSTIHSKYSVPIALFSSTVSAKHTHLVDDWLIGPGNGDVNPLDIAAVLLKWNAKAMGKPEPRLRVLGPAPVALPAASPQMMPEGMQMPQTNQPSSPMSSTQQPAQMQPQQALNATGGASSSSPMFQPLMTSLMDELNMLKAEVQNKKAQGSKSDKIDVKQITEMVVQSISTWEGQALARALKEEIKELEEQKLSQLREKAAAERKKREAEAAEKKRRDEEEAAAKKCKEDEEAATRRKEAEEAAEKTRLEEEAAAAAAAAEEERKRKEKESRVISPSERRQNALRLSSHTVDFSDMEAD